MPPYSPGPSFRSGSGYGNRPAPVPGASTFHRGQDFPASTGTSIPSAADGKVYYSSSIPGYGNTVVLEHNINGTRVYTLYAHLNQPSSLRKGDIVKQGVSVGNVGNTGRGSGPHLHFEVIKDQANPLAKGHDTYDPRTFNFPAPPVPPPVAQPIPSRTDGGAGGSNDGRGADGGTGGAGARAGASGTTPPRRDPLVLDLDGDGIETTSPRDTTVILFDHDADGVKTGTGWVKPDDGWLVLDRNGNGIIDSGRELFGIDTLKSNGQFAADGFDALKDLDANKDGKIDSADSVFANLRIWRDLNQDGISQSNELSTLAANSITRIGVNSSAVNTDLGNGNVQTAAGTFTRSNGTTSATGETNGAAANLDLLVNTFYRTYTTQITLTDQSKSLPTLRGSGRVRDLNEAISLSPDLGNWVKTYTQQTTRQGQIDKLDGFIEKWANTADLKSLKAQADALTGSGVKMTYNLAGLAAGTPAFADFVRKLGVVERFMGFTYGGPNGQARFTPLNATSGNLTVSLAAEQIASISLAYERFKTDIYESLLLDTRLEPIYSQADFNLVNGAWVSDWSGVELTFKTRIKANPNDGIIDLLEFISALGHKTASDMGWDATAYLVTQLNSSPDLGAFTEELSSWSVRFAGGTENSLTGTSRPDLSVDTNMANNLFGRDGNDLLAAKGGDDSIFGENGADTLDGGAGNDWLDGGRGNNAYLFGKGDGQDIVDAVYDTTAGKLSTLQFKSGVLPSEVVAKRVYDSGYESLELSIAGTTDKITVRYYFSGNDPANAYNPVQQVKFADGTVWNTATILSKVFAGTAAADSITGTNAADVINGQAGADTIYGRDGNDTINGGADADALYGENGADTLDGGAGKDTLTGGSGLDVFKFSFASDSGLLQSSADLITDFTVGQGDLIDLSLIDAIVLTIANEAFSYIGSSAFTAAGQARSYFSGGATFVDLNTNHDFYAPEMIIAFSGIISLKASNFIL